MKIRTAILTMLLWTGIVAGAAAQVVEGKAVEVDGAVVATVGQGRVEIRCRGLSFQAENIPAGSPATFCAIPLNPEQLPPVPVTMKVVSGGRCPGYRLLSGGEHFPEGATVRLTYDPSKIPAGHSFRDIRTYYYDETAHELKHAYQFETGDLSFSASDGSAGLLYDLTDEFEAHQRGEALGGDKSNHNRINYRYRNLNKNRMGIDDVHSIWQYFFTDSPQIYRYKNHNEEKSQTYKGKQLIKK